MKGITQAELEEAERIWNEIESFPGQLELALVISEGIESWISQNQCDRLEDAQCLISIIDHENDKLLKTLRNAKKLFEADQHRQRLNRERSRRTKLQ